MRNLTQTVTYAKAPEGAGSSNAAQGGEQAPAGEATNEPLAAGNSALVYESNKERVEAIKKGFGGERAVFPTLALALAKAEEVGKATVIGEGESALPFYGLPVGIRGQKDDGSFDESIYLNARAVIGIVGVKLDKATGIKGITIYPIPTVDAFIGSEVGKAFIDKLVVKECSHVGFRPMRDAATSYDWDKGVEAWPTTVDDYATSASRGIDSDTFDTIWGSFRKSLSKKNAALADLLPTKPVFLDCLRSRAFALSDPNTAPLENQGWFAMLGKVLVQAAANWKDEKGIVTPLETDTLQSWLDGRDSLVLEKSAPTPKDFSVLANMKLDFA